MSKLLQRKSVIKVKEYLEYIDNSIKLIVLDETARTAVDAARSLKINDVGAIVKSLLFKTLESNDYYNGHIRVRIHGSGILREKTTKGILKEKAST